ncbi:LysR family transcriptional regulator [Paraburkholderia humisilvae]|uniref:HTH-type transcriptional regulator PgrR n=1 Tax=Paraburkholderia humisilvae TaxID=627669 RepID=A0A6J5F4I2_9BURK|nr:LysR family transcriptional regulator [Paraburkholderia humisilvae]CAB3772512.1 HTH-type transcriptional regulator PgrR [Paraburkholderia humisilvae]
MARIFNPIQLGSIELFCKTAELGSFVAAAQALSITPGAVSRSIGRLEERLGVRLFVRTTRRISLTDEGALYHAECQQALKQIAGVEREISGKQREPGGVLRVSAPTTYGHSRLVPMIARFCEAFPRVDVELELSNHNIDFVNDGFDVAIRRGEPPDSRLIARPLENARFGLYAAPAYLARRGAPVSTGELAHHDCIQFVLPSNGRPLPWQLRGEDGKNIDFLFSSRYRVQGDVLGCVTLARAGAGICQVYQFVAQEAVDRGELVEILETENGVSRPFSLLYPRNRHLSARVRAFVDFVLEEVGREIR